MASIQFVVLIGMALFVLWCGASFTLAALVLKRIKEIIKAFPPWSWFTYAELEDLNFKGYLTRACIYAMIEKQVLDLAWNNPPPDPSKDFKKIISDDHSMLYACRFRVVRQLPRRRKGFKNITGSLLPDGS